MTIQFHADLFYESFLNKNQLSFIRTMFDKSRQDIHFSRETILEVKNRLLALKGKLGFDDNHEQSNSRRIAKAFQYMNAYYNQHITLSDVAAQINMHEASFSRFVKRITGKTFVDSLNEIRLGHAARLLIDTNQTIAEIAYGCGFNNISNFNRMFKNKKNCTPKEFRNNFSGSRIYI